MNFNEKNTKTLQSLRVLLSFTSDELKIIFKGSNSCESAKSVVKVLDIAGRPCREAVRVSLN